MSYFNSADFVPKNPVELLDNTIAYSMFCETRRFGPGQIVERMSEARREILRTLKSDDIANIRIPRPQDYPQYKPEPSDTMKVFAIKAKDCHENLLCQRPPRSSS